MGAVSDSSRTPGSWREFGLILDNLDGLDDLSDRFVMRAVRRALALRSSVARHTGANRLVGRQGTR